MTDKTRQIDLLCAQALFRSATGSNIASAAGSMLVGLYFFQNMHVNMFNWMIFMCIISGVRIVQARRFLRSWDKAPANTPLDTTVLLRQIRSYQFLSMVAGIGWAMLTLMIPVNAEPLHISILYIVLFSIMSAAFISLSAMLSIFFVYITPVFVASLIYSLQLGEGQAVYISIAITVYFLFATVAGYTINRHFRQNFFLLIENEDLIAQLSNEITQKEAYEERLMQNQQDLEKTVQQRTSELSEVNRELKEVNRALVSEINERRRIEANLQHMAHHDSLTNLPNRLLLDARLSHSISRARRDQSRIAVIFIDLDHFKLINDSLGHDIGDRLLVETSQRLLECVRDEDTVARLGGDEFIMIIEQVHETEQLDILLNKVMQKVSQPLYIDEHKLSTSASIGISIFPDDGDSTEQLMQNADAAMYYVKEHGRHKYHFYTHDISASRDRLALETDLKQAIDNNQILIHYQPQVCLKSKKIIGAEALVRWRHPERGILAPAQFLELAEHCGIMTQIGERVLMLACQQIVRWKKQGLDIERVAVNIAGSQIHNGDLLDVVRRTLQDTGCSSDWLELEITEDFIIKETARSIETLQQLRQLGLSLAIDDFGIGYSSLSRLKQLPVNKLKIDRAFIRDITTDMEDAALVNAIITMGRNLNMKLIAEGVENGSHEIFLSAHGCEYAQGFYYAKPLPADELEAMLMKP
ncbi:MAG TPA: EAL domain-containing protein [Gammaproteobacteria bacterium]|nr:EAL domain-containing protein [Gammaproteobacteria bacterium]